MNIVVVCVWAACVCYVAARLLWEWEDFDADARRINAGVGMSLLDDDFVIRTAVVGLLIFSPAVAAWDAWLVARWGAGRAAAWLARRMPCRHRPGKRCRRCGRTMYRVGSEAAVVDARYPDWG